MSKSKEKDAFLMRKSWERAIKRLSDEAAGRFLKAVYDYQVNGKEPQEDAAIQPLLDIVIPVFDLDISRYNATCEKRREVIQEYWDGVRKDKDNEDTPAPASEETPKPAAPGPKPGKDTEPPNWPTQTRKIQNLFKRQGQPQAAFNFINYQMGECEWKLSNGAPINTWNDMETAVSEYIRLFVKKED